VWVSLTKTTQLMSKESYLARNEAWEFIKKDEYSNPLAVWEEYKEIHALYYDYEDLTTYHVVWSCNKTSLVEVKKRVEAVGIIQW